MIQIEKELKDISWLVDEPTYRADPALSYSTLAKYEREGFNKLSSLFDHISTPSLVLGSIVDTLITGSMDDFNSLFYVSDFNSVGEKERKIADRLFEECKDKYLTLDSIPTEPILNAAVEVGYYPNWKPETRVKVIRDKCEEYYNTLYYAKGKTVVSSEVYNKALQMVNALKTSPATAGYFADNNEDTPIRRYYQLKFKFSHDGVDYRSMADNLVVDYEDKTVIPIDLKTSGHNEWDFQDSFTQWSYMIQARLYWRNIRAAMDADPYFKDFKLLDYRFIVVNKDSLCPLVWEFPLTASVGTLIDDKGNEYRDPYVIGKELYHYLTENPQVPVGINQYGLNEITKLRIKP